MQILFYTIALLKSNCVRLLLGFVKLVEKQICRRDEESMTELSAEPLAFCFNE